MLDDLDDVRLIGCGEVGGCGIALHELVENGESNGAACFVQENDGDEKAERVMGKAFLD